jgi:hypothetical protein
MRRLQPPESHQGIKDEETRDRPFRCREHYHGYARRLRYLTARDAVAGE